MVITIDQITRQRDENAQMIDAMQERIDSALLSTFDVESHSAVVIGVPPGYEAIHDAMQDMYAAAGWELQLVTPPALGDTYRLRIQQRANDESNLIHYDFRESQDFLPKQLV